MNNKQKAENSLDMKQTFLSNAIADISSYIQLADTKVSIIMAAVVAILVGTLTCYEPIIILVSNIKPCSWLGVLFLIFTLLTFVSVIAIFVFGILTIRGHASIIAYKSKWFLSKTTKEYSFDEFSKDIQEMDDEDIIKNMAAELYKLNDINRQKMQTLKWCLKSFSLLLISIVIIAVLFFINLL